ncbi:prepilin peptidase-dependent protein [Serratia rubidaea]|uniref:Prepilin peptidase-dependent protein n=1 Tax=Serratia rubidaea TaxID=61652 RepID=A0A448SF51_SERRU|nr:prepilin peptidase-dependent protein [Serratia rubidaea]MBH1932095.1 prepilin peptidase-dependent protein [Serratia rubidaea]MDC6117765.1 prepilin peptidase-dependent protein [Serratia rubidaea]VEI66271.1 Type II secretory pathway, component PulJ [Serratia rubidaea]
MLTPSRGFTLPEVLLAMAAGSLIMLATTKAYPALRQQSAAFLGAYQLELRLRQAAFGIEKDLRRAGFCAGRCAGRPLTIARHAGEEADSCVIVAYDLNRNGRWETAGDEAEKFGYRLRAGRLERQRGVSQCNGGGWENLFERDEVRIETFSIRLLPGNNGRRLLRLALSGRSASAVGHARSIRWDINVEAPSS